MNPSALSRSDLVRELFAPAKWGFTEMVPRVGDHEPTYHAIAANDPALTRKLSVARELLMRDLQAQMSQGAVMSSPDVLRDWLRLYCAKLEYEVFLVLYLNAQLQLIEAVELFRGTLTQTAVYPREVVKTALARNAAAVIFAHNHPSGDPEPSLCDREVTRDLVFAARVVQIRVLDHIIIGNNRYFSFADQGLIDDYDLMFNGFPR